jgi:hypothetical protein
LFFLLILFVSLSLYSAKLDPPPPGPTPEELYKNLTLHKSSHKKKYEHMQAIEDSKKGKGGGGSSIHSKTSINHKGSTMRKGGGGGASVATTMTVDGGVETVCSENDTQTSSSSQALLKANRSPMSVEDAHIWLSGDSSFMLIDYSFVDRLHS